MRDRADELNDPFHNERSSRCVPPPIADRADALVGADLADRTIQRYTVVLGSPKGRCTGVVLAQDIVLTAAHCIVPGGEALGRRQIGGGSQHLPPSQLSAVDEDRPSTPLFSRKDTGSPDPAILRLAKPLPDRFDPGRAEIARTSRRRADNLIAAGYGKTSPHE